MALDRLEAQLKPTDSKDIWRDYGNAEPDLIPEMEVKEFLKTAHRRPREVE